MLNMTDRKDLLIADLLDLQKLSGKDINAARGFEALIAQNIHGREEGFNEAGDIITETSDGFPLNKMWTEFQKVINMWNGQRDALTNLLTFNVTEPVEGVRYPVETDFQEASEFGVPTSGRLGPAFSMGYDFKFWDLAIRYTWMFLLDCSAEQLRALNNQALEADNRLMFSRIMRAVFNNVTRTATIDDVAVNVYPFYNGDSMVPPKWKSTVHSSAHTHYLESGGTTVDPGDVQAMIDHLTHHGYTAARGYRVILLCNSQEGTTIRDFTKGTASAKYSFIPGTNYGGGVYLPANSGIVGQPTIAAIPGLESIGTYGPATVIEEDYIPAGYMVMFVTAGEQNIGNPVGIREHESLKGLRLVKGRDNAYPLVDSYYVHGMGTGVRHRGAGVVMEIANGGTYTIPTDYD